MTLAELLGAAPVQRSRWWLAAITALVTVVSVPLLLRRDEGSIHRLVAVVPHSVRVVEPRLTGGFPWAAYAGAHRAAGEAKDAGQLKLGGVAGELVERADRGSGEGQHAAGVALVLMQQPVEAIPRLEAAAGQSNEPQAWSDLAAARVAAASQLGRASLYPAALAAADRALRIDPNLVEARFNRALILERLGLIAEAKSAWQLYLQADPSSEWAAEARSRLVQWPASTDASQFERDRPLLELAAVRGDAAGVRRYVDAYRDRARAYAEGEYLGHWAEAQQRNDGAEAGRWLSIARATGDTLSGISGDTLLRDAVRAIDGGSPTVQRAIAAAHILYRNGRIAYSRDQRDAAERDLRLAAEAFEAARDPMGLQAAYYAASARLAGNDVAGARRDLERMLPAANAHPDYISFGAHVRWELGRARSNENDWSGAASVLAEGAAMFERIGERASEGFVETNLAFALSSLGRNDEAWLARMRGFAASSAEGDAPRLATGIAAAAYAELAAGHRDGALALMATETALAFNKARPQMAISGLITRAVLQSMNGDPAAAMQTARRAGELAQAVPDPQLRDNWMARVGIATGAALAPQNPRAAAEPLTRSIDYYTAHAMTGALLDPLLLRSRCAARTGDVPSALGDLERGMSFVESHPAATPGIGAGFGLFDAEHAVFTDAIRLSLDRGDKAGAFAIAERSHGTPVTLPELQHRLAGSGTAVLELVALPDELVAFAVTGNDAVVFRRPMTEETLLALADESLSETGTTAAAKLYEELIRPADAVLDRARGVVIVADTRLATVPFAALYDSVHGRFLIERLAVSAASSAGSLQAQDGRAARPALAAVALPSGGTDSLLLPDAQNEVRDVTRLYARAAAVPTAAPTFAEFLTLSAGADIVHIAGHTEGQPGAGEQALLFAGPAGVLDRVSWKTVVASPSPNRGVVVLAACETLRPPPSAATHALSLGGAFLAAGASDVVGTLTPVGDRDARLLFRALHRQLASGTNPAEALRAVQQDAIAMEKTNGGHRAWRAIALWTRHFPVPIAERSSRRG